MPEELKIIWILAVGLGLACAGGYIAQRLKLSPIIGYLAAGFLIGPHSPGFIADKSISDQLANIGVTLLMFAVGLNFNWKDITAVKKIVVPGALVLSALSITAGILLNLYLKGSVTQGFVMGVAICVSSTVVIVRVLGDQNLLHTKRGHIVVGWTIIEDLVSVLGLILIPALICCTTPHENATLEILYSILIVLLKVAGFILIIFLIGEKLIDRILKLIARTRSHELFTLAILASVFLVAVGSSYLFGISLALGAFIAGTVVGKTELSHQAAANALPMRDAFAVIFFLSVGMLFNPMALKENIPLFAGVLIIILLIRPFFAFLMIKMGKYPTYVAFTVAFAISQIGEYSFILAEEGSRLNVLPDNAYDILIACAFITIALNPILFKIFKPLLIAKVKTPGTFSEQHLDDLYSIKGNAKSFLPRAIVIGYGPIGKQVSAFLSKQHQVLVIEHNIDTVSAFKKGPIDMLYGDPAQLQILERANIENVQLIVITISNLRMTTTIIDTVQHINPQADIIARIHYQSDYDPAKFGDIPIICDEQAVSEKMIATIAARHAI